MAPSALGLPVYSASGFDLLSILARIATRPTPRVSLGPVDLTCSFVVVDVRRYDHPIVYCSPSFCRLTGYSENEVLGRNCRFLQAPPSVGVRRGEERVYTDGERVKSMRKMLAADKECQVSIVNYRRDATAFCNLLTVIPIGGGEAGEGGESDIVYHVGFQVDLGEQPNIILRKLKEGSYAGGLPMQQQPALTSRDTAGNGKKGMVIPPLVMSKALKNLLKNPAFIASLPISTSTTITPPLPASATAAHESSRLSLILLEHSPDFVHVVSLKGAFLYVAPSVRRVLGWEPEELVGKCVTDLAHPEDVIPLMRELKEGSAAGAQAGGADKGSSGDSASTISSGSDTKGSTGTNAGGASPHTVDMLFRARTRAGRYVWVESRGRLYVEPGKGRKAIVLSGRAREMGRVSWGAVAERGMQRPVYVPVNPTGESDQNGKTEKVTVDSGKGNERERGSNGQVVRREFWAMVSGSGSASFLAVGAGVTDVLGWEAEELVGRRVRALVVDVDGGADGVAEGELQRGGGGEEMVREVRCAMARKDGGVAGVVVVFYPSTNQQGEEGKDEGLNVSPAPVVVQVKLVDVSTSASGASPVNLSSGSANTASPLPLVHPLDTSIFDELETARGTSWQYELEKLRFANVRLEQEVERLETMVGNDDVPSLTKTHGVGVPMIGDGDPQCHPHGDLPVDDPLRTLPGEFGPSVQQQHERQRQQDRYEQQYQAQARPKYREQQRTEPPQLDARQMQGGRYVSHPQPQRQQLQSHLHLSSQASQQQNSQHQGMYASAPLQAPVPQTMTLPPLLQHQHHNDNGDYSYQSRQHQHHQHQQHQQQYLELGGGEPEQEEHQRKRTKLTSMASRIHVGSSHLDGHVQLPSRMPAAPVTQMRYTTSQSGPPLPPPQPPSPAPSLQGVLQGPPQPSLVSMQEWILQQQRYAPPPLRGSKRAWPGRES